MELKEFIKETLIQISEGIIESQKNLSEKGAVIVPKYSVKGTDFHFVDENNSTRQQVNDVNFKVGIKVENISGEKAGIAVITGLFSAAGQASSENVNQSISSIEFTIPVIYPSGNNPERRDGNFVLAGGKVTR